MADASKSLRSADEIAALCDDFVKHVGAYLEWQKITNLTAQTHKPGSLGGQALEEFGTRLVEFDRRKNEEGSWLRENGPTLAAALEQHGFDSSEVLRIVHCAGRSGGGPVYILPKWEDTKVALQRAAIQLRGSESKEGAGRPTTAKGENMPDTRFCKTALLALRGRAEKAASDCLPLWHMLVLPEGESLWVPERPGCHGVGSFRSEPTGPKCTFGTSHLIGPLPPTVSWPHGLEPVCAVVAEQEFLPFRPLAHKPYRIHLFFGHGEGQTAFESLAGDMVNLSTDIKRALELRLGGVFYHANDSLHDEKAAILDTWLCTIHWWAWKATDSPLHTSPKVVFGGTSIESHRMDDAVGQKLSYSLVNCNVFTATARTIDLFLRFFDVRPNLVYAVDYPEPQTTTEKEGSDDRAPPSPSPPADKTGHGETGGTMGELRSFIVHGHDENAKLALKNYLQNTLRWPEPVILAEKRSGGKTIIEKFEDQSKNIDVVFVLLTPDDVGGAVGGPSAAHARQNVILELGYFAAKFGRTSGRVILLHKGDLELPSDVAGIVYIDISHGVEAAGESIRREVATLVRIN